MTRVSSPDGPIFSVNPKIQDLSNWLSENTTTTVNGQASKKHLMTKLG